MGIRGTDARALARKRRLVGLTQHSLSEATGIPVARIAYGETGRIVFEPTELDKIRAVLRARGKQVAAAVGAA